MSRKYDEYLSNHIRSVVDSYHFLCEAGVFERDEIIERQIEKHDASKYDDEEYDAYDTYFNDYDENNRPDEVVEEFNYAWCHHLHHNPHHWQHWVIIPDPEDDETVLDIPQNYFVEMICDWLSFSMLKYEESGNPSDLWGFVDWYQKNKGDIKFSTYTADKVELVVQQVSDVIVSLEGSS